MKYFIDTEFMEKPNTIKLISIGIVAEDNRTFYAESNEFDPDQANSWVKKNVLPKLIHNPYDRQNNGYLVTVEPDGSREIIGPEMLIRDHISQFIGDDVPEFFGYYADYDWVVFCWLFGAMIDLPHGWPMYCKDVKQLADESAAPRIGQFEGTAHNALGDAKWIKAYHDIIRDGDWDKKL